MDKSTFADLVYKVNKKLYYQLRYFLTRGKLANFKQPSNLSEYLLSEMLKPSFKKFAFYADKLAVRNYVEDKGFASILPQHYGVWEDANQIDFTRLPSQFVLKTNHGCGQHIICRDKTKLDCQSAIQKLNRTLEQVFSIREPHYQYITPKVFAEELIDDGMGKLPIDYKFMCVKGEPICILICTDREMEQDLPLLAVYTPEWKRLDWLQRNINERDEPRPRHLDEMLQIAQALSSDFEFVRVDLYDCPNGVVFGELTFTPASGLMGYFTEEALEIMNPYK